MPSAFTLCRRLSDNLVDIETYLDASIIEHSYASQKCIKTKGKGGGGGLGLQVNSYSKSSKA